MQGTHHTRVKPGLKVSRYWYLDIEYRKVWSIYDAVIRISKGTHVLDAPPRDAGTIVRNYNRESNQD